MDQIEPTWVIGFFHCACGCPPTPTPGRSPKPPTGLSSKKGGAGGGGGLSAECHQSGQFFWPTSGPLWPIFGLTGQHPFILIRPLPSRFGSVQLGPIPVFIIMAHFLVISISFGGGCYFLVNLAPSGATLADFQVC